ncbi:phage antirepressor KilAC domain-containing protein [Pseudoclostridium thermosuccinogenes]|uniref:phage antirepressor KilAC domain-containing protein n=1 Tax=Clostridium thermosuccinogenes TaxID=84032 RepID=UPI002FD9AD59
MNELIKINYDGDRQTTSARALWEFLDKPWREFLKWFNQFKDYGFTENVDYRVIECLSENPQGGRPATDYEITIDMAKELAMLQKTEKGKMARQYFIELEKAWNSPEMVMSRALKLAERKIMSLEEERQKLLPKAQAYDTFIDGSNLQTMNDVAKCLGIGRNKLFGLLREKKIIRSNNTPYQEYIDRGYFEVKEKPIKMGDASINYAQTYVTAKGVAYISKVIVKSA